MGRVRTKTVKRAAKVLLERHYQKLTNDFHINKKILSEVAKVPTKSLRNKIAGFATHLVKRIQRGPVKGISLKVQEEERERRLDWVPKESEINISKVPSPLLRSPSIMKLLICSSVDSEMTSPLPSVPILKSRLPKLFARMLREERENPESKEVIDLRESPERIRRRRKKKRQLKKLLSKRKLPRLMLPSVRAEEEVAAKGKSDVVLNL